MMKAPWGYAMYKTETKTVHCPLSNLTITVTVRPCIYACCAAKKPHREPFLSGLWARLEMMGIVSFVS